MQESLVKIRIENLSKSTEGVGITMARWCGWAGLGVRSEGDLSKWILNVDNF